MQNIDELIERVQSTHQRYLEEKEKFAEGIKKSEEQVASLTAELESTRKDLISTKGNLARVQDESDNYKSNIGARDEEVNSLRKDITVVTSLLDEEKEKYNTAITELASLKDSIAEADSNYQRLSDFTESLKGQLHDSETATAGMENKYVDAINQYKKLEEELASIKSECDKSKESLELSNSNYKLLEDRYNAQQEEVEHISELKETLASKDDIIKQLNKQVEELQHMVSSYEDAKNKGHSLEVRAPKTTALQDFIESTIPIPKDSAAAEVSVATEISKDTLPYRFGRTSSYVMSNVKRLVEALFDDVVVNNRGEYPLNNPLKVIERIGMDTNTYEVTMKRLQAMTYDRKPLVIYKENMYYATIDSKTMLDYIMEQQ